MLQKRQAVHDFTDKSIEYVHEGITFLAAGQYYEDDNKPIAKLLKTGDRIAIEYATRKMASLLDREKPWVLVPMPGHHGKADQTLELCKSLSWATGFPVCDVLKGYDRISNYEAKKNGTPLTEAQLGLRQMERLPSGCIPVVVDNVADTGVSAKAAIHALGRGVVLTFAITDVMMQQEERIASKSFHR